jgi:hypothetical protein
MFPPQAPISLQGTSRSPAETPIIARVAHWLQSVTSFVPPASADRSPTGLACTSSDSSSLVSPPQGDTVLMNVGVGNLDDPE